MGNDKMFEKWLFWSAPVESKTALMRNQQAFFHYIAQENQQNIQDYSNERKGFDCFQEGGLQRKTKK